MDTGVRDLEVACFKANSNDIRTKDLSTRPICAVLNTHNLDMILQLKYMPIVMNPARIASSDWNPRNVMFFDAPYQCSDLQTWHQKCTSQKRQNDTY